MSAASRLRPAFVETFPATLDQGVLYISITYRTCGHLCCCGCGEEVITPLSPAQWSVTYNGETVSLAPSIGNWALACQSHYWIRNGDIHWSRRYSAQEIAANCERDRGRLDEASADADRTSLARLRRRLNRWRR
ncbi:DUF6527 family protein [Streptomyces sp. LUP30]|uniref:DUF6527 family protein n=1 Tax=Streptomyces sp. LUP30 TaxID=1890285 RepID=UPI0008519F59|nr:DUF6527 family protein [Streptomyces sp. LUP30]